MMGGGYNESTRKTIQQRDETKIISFNKNGVRDLILFNYYTNEVMRELAI